jgi:creatinine amidohydrolase/Fe(II)-dependent formamide hydrolase-like protein
MDLDKAAFLADSKRSEKNGGWRLWQELVIHTVFQIQTLGFKLIVLIPGHYPLIGPLNQAVSQYLDQGGTSDVFVLTDMMTAKDGKAGDHAAAFETSLLMALAPDLVNLQELDADLSIPPIGVLGEDPRVSASADFGVQILAKMTELVRARLPGQP